MTWPHGAGEGNISKTGNTGAGRQRAGLWGNSTAGAIQATGLKS